MSGSDEDEREGPGSGRDEDRRGDARSDRRSGVTVVENAICIHEEDAGILWRHFDRDANTAHVRRNRRLQARREDVPIG